MKVRMYFLRLSVLVTLASVIIAGAPAQAQEASPTLNPFLTWEADVFTPPHYRGRSVPPPGGTATMNIAAVDGRGVLVDLSSYRIVWSHTRTFLEGGTGLTTLSVRLGSSPGRDLIRAVIYGANGEVVAEVSTVIPTARPRIVLTPEPAPASSDMVLIRALPLSFSVSNAANLILSWSVPGGIPGDSFDTFLVPATPSLSVVGWVAARNPARVLESARQYLKLPYATFE